MKSFYCLLILFVWIFCQGCQSKKSIYFLITNTNQRHTRIPLEIEIEGRIVYYDTIVNRNISPDFDELCYSTIKDSITVIFKSPYLSKPEKRIVDLNKKDNHAFVTFSSKYENYKINNDSGSIYPNDTLDEFGFLLVDKKPLLM